MTPETVLESKFPSRVAMGLVVAEFCNYSGLEGIAWDEENGVLVTESENIPAQAVGLLTQAAWRLDQPELYDISDLIFQAAYVSDIMF